MKFRYSRETGNVSICWNKVYWGRVRQDALPSISRAVREHSKEKGNLIPNTHKDLIFDDPLGGWQ